MSAHPKLAAARVVLARRLPYLAAGLWRLELHVLDAWPAGAQGEIVVDARGRVAASRALVERATVPQLAGALLHELGHVLREHARRRGARDPDRWNLAGDAAINPGVLRSFPLPYEGVVPSALPGAPAEGLTAEEYYQSLEPPPAPPPPPPPPPEEEAEADPGESPEAPGAEASEGPGAGDDTGGTGGAGENADGSEPSVAPPASPPPDNCDEGPPDGPSAPDRAWGGADGSEDAADAAASPSAPSGPPTCGSGAGGHRHPAEDALPAAAEGSGGTDPEDWHAVAAQVAHEVREASRTRGDVPGDWQAWAQETLAPPEIPWQRVLAAEIRAAATRSGACDYTYARPSRRGAYSAAILPSLRAPRLRVHVLVDTSGSRSDAMLAQDVVEVASIARAAGADRVRVIACDAQVQREGEVRTARDVRPLLVGRGGTDMRVGLARAVAPVRGERPDLLAVLTDGETPWPDRAPRVRALVVLPRGGPVTPTWARRIETGARP